MGLVGVAATATAGPIPYNINFSGGSPNPTAGSFIYDADSPLFTSFIVIWQGISFDLTSSANNAFSFGACHTVGNDAADAFAYLSNPTCGSGAVNDGWTAFQGIAVGFDSFQFYRGSGGDFVRFSGQTPSSQLVSILTTGTFSITATPEPSSMALLLSGGALFAWTRKRRSATSPSDLTKQ
jgi:hypothetical protein